MLYNTETIQNIEGSVDGRPKRQLQFNLIFLREIKRLTGLKLKYYYCIKIG